MKIDLDNIDWDQFDREHIREHAIHDAPEEFALHLGDGFQDLQNAADCGEENPDFDNPAQFASAVSRSSGHANLLVRRMAAWTDELIATPRVWTTVTSLAEKLEHGIEMPGEKACEIMDSAWG